MIEKWELKKWVWWAWGERGQVRLEGGGCWAGWGCCLRGQRVLSEVAVAVVAAAVGLVAEAAAVVQVDVAAPHC